MVTLALMVGLALALVAGLIWLLSSPSFAKPS